MAVSQISASPIPDADAEPQQRRPNQPRDGRQVVAAVAPVVPIEVRKTVLI